MNCRTRFFLTAGSGLFASLFVVMMPWAGAQTPPTAEGCLARINAELVDRVDEARAIVYGARRLPSGGFALTTGPVVSPSLAAVLASAPTTQGILETRGRLTSELLEPLLETQRVLRCRSAAVCLVAGDSIEQRGGTSTVRVLGCEEQSLPRYDECFVASDPAANQRSVSPTLDRVSIQASCADLVSRTMETEAALLRSAVAYDAEYRASLQFAGIMDWVTQDASSKAVEPLRDMVGLLGKLHQIPCFIGQCDWPDTRALQP